MKPLGRKSRIAEEVVTALLCTAAVRLVDAIADHLERKRRRRDRAKREKAMQG